MIAFASPIFDLNGHLIINESPNTNRPTLKRRITRTATLDGLSTFNDSGHTYSDGTYQIELLDADDATRAQLEYLIKTYPLLNLSSTEGAFIGAMETLNIDTNPILLRFIIKQITSE